jgi:ubiquinone biosynthesis protein UbiJ
MAPFALSLTVREDGGVVRAAPGANPDATVRLTPGLALRLSARDETAWREVEAAGDVEFVAVVSRVARNLRWDVEEDLSRVFGDIPAHRMAETGRGLRRWGGQALENTGRSFAEYWTEEQPLLARAHEVEQFNRAVDELRDAVARLEKRIDQAAGRGR